MRPSIPGYQSICGPQASPTRTRGYLYLGPCLGLWPFAVGLSRGHGCFLVNCLIPYGNGNGMVMVSITFAFLSRGLQAHLRPAGFPHAHPRISNILGHGSRLMAISLLAIWLVPWPKPRLGLRPRQWPQAQGLRLLLIMLLTYLLTYFTYLLTGQTLRSGV